MPDVFKRAHANKGASFVEIFQNCIVYNDGVFSAFSEKANAAETRVYAVHDQPLRFGADNEKGLRLNSDELRLEVVQPGKDGVQDEDIIVHDETNPILAQMLVSLMPPAYPVVLGVIYANPSESFEAATTKQIEASIEENGPGDLTAIFHQGQTWTVT